MSLKPSDRTLAGVAVLALAIGYGAASAILAASGRQPVLGGAAMTSAPETTNPFARPKAIPYPGTTPPTAAQVALGAKLFSDGRLSANGTVSCASCHDPELAFTDGVTRGKGIADVKLSRHTPTLWNLAWSETLFWDGRAPSLEAQAKGPIENPLEMAQPIAQGAARLAADPAMASAFAAAFPQDPAVSPANITRALADYERTLVSPPTRFDRFVAGDTAALSPSEQRGFSLFTGAGHCATCHSGWAFTDRAFHDIGLPTDDLGRGAVIGLPAVNHAFKTPTLRELAWTAPYMHDGSLATLDDVVRHYASGGVARASLSPDLPKGFEPTDDDRRDLVAFLGSLSSDRPPRADASLAFEGGAKPVEPPSVVTSKVIQKDKAFLPTGVRVKVGETLSVINDDTRPHNVRVFDPRLEYNSGLQEPGDTARITFGQSGTFDVFCGIHPSMKLTVTVE